MSKPNFFIIGGPKCGTTALAAYLRDHPNIFIPSVKEPHYFADDLWQFHDYYRKTEADYLALFAEVAEETAVGEASVFYAYSDTALANIAAYNSDAKIIMMVRNPIDVVYSLHAQYLYNGFDETESDFETAWRLQSDRALGLNLPKKYQGVTDKSAYMLQYGNIGRFGEQYARVCKHFPPDKIKLITFDDFKQDNQAVYEDVLNFLDVPYLGRTNFPKINQNTVRKAASLRHLAKTASMNPTLIKSLRKVKKAVGVSSFGLMNQIDTTTTSVAKRAPLSEPFRQELALYFAEDSLHLSQQTHHDFSHWLKQDRSPIVAS